MYRILQKALCIATLGCGLVDVTNAQTGQLDELVLLVQKGEYAEIERLLESDIDVTSAGSTNISPLQSAVGCHRLVSDFSVHAAGEKTQVNPWIVSLLLATGANPNEKGVQGSTPLVCAVFHNSLGSAWLLLRYGADPNELNDIGMTPLMYAAEHCFKDMITLLLEHGGDQNLRNSRGETAIAVGQSMECDFTWQ